MRFNAFMFEYICCFCAYWQLDYALGLLIPRIPGLNAYDVLTVFMQTLQFTISATTKTRITVTQEGTRVIKQFGRESSIVERLTDKVLRHVKDTEGWQFAQYYGRFGLVNNSEGTEN